MSTLEYTMSNPQVPVPHHILIIGAGVFGLSTTLALLSNPTYNSTKITIVDGSSSLPNPTGSSVDASRIIRPDYAQQHYSRLALEAQEYWRDTKKEAWGGEGRYHEPGFVLSVDKDRGDYDYLKDSLANVRRFAAEDDKGRADLNKIQELDGPDEIRKATGYEGATGDYGYANFNSGWADAEACVAYALKRVWNKGGDRVKIRSGAKVQSLLFSGTECSGVLLVGGEDINADLTILAAGAWSPTLINLQGRCLATGQAMAYVDITEEEQKAMENRPTIMNLSRGMFIIPPRGKELKIARHGFGYRNLVKIPRKGLEGGLPNGCLDSPESEFVQVSVPKVETPIPVEAQETYRKALRELLPQMANRPFTRTRICWYCDT